MPTGKVKWYDADKGFGFLTRDDGGTELVEPGISTERVDQPLEALLPGVLAEVGEAGLRARLVGKPTCIEPAHLDGSRPARERAAGT